MAKWSLVLKAAPVAVIVLLLRAAVHTVDSLKGMVTFADTGAVLTGAALIMGLMLGGVIGDYREAEKLIPAVGGLFVGFESYARRSQEVIGKDGSWVHDRVAVVARAVNDWLYGKVDTGAMWAAYEDINRIADKVATEGATIPFQNQVNGANNSLGGALDRIDNIRSTSFIKSGYALLEFLVGVVLMLMVVCTFDNTVASYLVPAAVSMIYVFMVLFIKDLDNPFGYGDNDGKGSAADVDITYWTNVFKLYK